MPLTPAPAQHELDQQPHLPGDSVAEQHGRQGSRARLAALQYLAHRPHGASTLALAEVLQLDTADTRYVLTCLRTDQRLASERLPSGTLNWYAPLARAGWRVGKPAGTRANRGGPL